MMTMMKKRWMKKMMIEEKLIKTPGKQILDSIADTCLQGTISSATQSFLSVVRTLFRCLYKDDTLLKI